MLVNRRGIKVFNEYDLRAILDGQISQLKREIESVDKLNPNEAINLVTNKVAEYTMEPLSLQTDRLTVTVSEREIPAEFFPSSFNVYAGKRYPKEVFSFHLPFSGNPILLRSVPSTRLMWTEEVEISGNEIIFELLNLSNSAEEIKSERDSMIKHLSEQASHVNNQVGVYNEGLKNVVKTAIDTANDKASKRSSILEELGTPLKDKETQLFQNPKDLPKKIPQPSNIESKQFDVFICHASEDKLYVNKLAKALKDAEIEVWYDDFQLGWGDDLRSEIDYGLKNSFFGIVVFSQSFLKRKQWTEYELSGLFQRERNGQKVILPILHEINIEDLKKYSPSFAGRLAKNSEDIESIVKELKILLKK